MYIIYIFIYYSITKKKSNLYGYARVYMCVCCIQLRGIGNSMLQCVCVCVCASQLHGVNVEKRNRQKQSQQQHSHKPQTIHYYNNTSLLNLFIRHLQINATKKKAL